MKKIISSLLIAAMVLCYMPSMAFAAAKANVAIEGLNVVPARVLTVKAGDTTASVNIGKGQISLDQGKLDAVLMEFAYEGTGNAELAKASMNNGSAKLVLAENYGFNVNGKAYKLKGRTTISFKLTPGHDLVKNKDLDHAGIIRYINMYANSVQGNTVTVTQEPGSYVPPIGPIEPEVKPGDQIVDKDTAVRPDGTVVETVIKKDKDAGTTTRTEVASSGNSVNAKVDVAADASKDDKAVDAALEKAKREASAIEKDNAGKEVKVQTSVTAEAASDAKLTAGLVEKIAAENIVLKVKTAAGAAAFDKKALIEIAKPAASKISEVKITVTRPAIDEIPAAVRKAAGEKSAIIDVRATVDGKAVSDFNGGKAAITLDIPAGITEPKAVYITVHGNTYDMGGETVEIDGKKMFQFVTDHFSYFAIEEKSVADAAIRATNEKLTKGVEATTLTGRAKAYTSNGKSRIKVTWTKSKGYRVDGYEVFKSTKKYSGFGNKAYYRTSDGSKNYYINTKELRKGKRYYFNVKGYRIIDGKKVYTQKIKVSAIAK